MTLSIKQSSRAMKDGWWEWSVRLAGPPDEIRRVNRVKYVLHPSFPNPVRTVTDVSSSFQLEESGWGEFRLYATVAYADGREERLEHDLVLQGARGRNAPGGNERSAVPLPRHLRTATPRWMLRVGTVIVAILLVTTYLLKASWPDGSGSIRLLGGHWVISAERDRQLTFVAIFSGALGGAAYSLIVLTNFVGRRRYLEASWIPWIWRRPLVGAGSGLVVAFVLRTLVLSGSATAEDVNTFGMSAMGALAGMFAHKATKKLPKLSDKLRQLRLKGNPLEPNVEAAERQTRAATASTE